MVAYLLGFGLLVPGPSGYCLAQELMMQVVVQGVHLADKTWNYALNYMKDGNLLFAPEGSLTKGGLPAMADASAVSDTLSSFLGGTSYQGTSGNIQNALAYKIYNAQVCMFESNIYNQKYKDDPSKPKAKIGAKYTYSMNMIAPEMNGSAIKPGTGVINFPGFGDANTAIAHNCGTMSLP